MNKRLTVICIVFSIAYIFIIGYYIGYAGSNFRRGFKDGYEDAVQNHERAKSERLFPVVQPKQGASETPTSVINLKTGENIEVGVSHMKIDIYNAEPLPLKLKIANIIRILSVFFVFGCIIYIPIQSFKAVRSLIKNEIFDMYNIKRIRRIGYSLLIIFAWSIFNLYVEVAKANYLVELENYKFVASVDDMDTPILFLGLVVLAFAEILKMALSIKEENDLTV